MGDKSKIEWTDATWSPITGCTKVSAGCAHCYAERTSARLQAMGMDKYANGFAVTCHPGALDEPFRWQRPRKIFVCSMGDLFHEAVPFEFIAAVFGVIAANPRHTFMVLTKRPDRMRAFFGWLLDGREWLQCRAQLLFRIGEPPGDNFGPQTRTPWPLPNAWVGVTAENQELANQRIPLLLQCPAEVRFVSCEPLLGFVDMTEAMYGPEPYGMNGFGFTDGYGYEAMIHWVICGGESGPGARPMHPDWVRNLRDQCQAAGTAFHFKQFGEWVPVDQPWEVDSPKPRARNERWLNLAGGHGFHGDAVWRMRRVGKRAAGRLLDGRTWDEFPKIERIQGERCGK